MNYRKIIYIIFFIVFSTFIIIGLYYFRVTRLQLSDQTRSGSQLAYPVFINNYVTIGEGKEWRLDYVQPVFKEIYKKGNDTFIKATYPFENVTHEINIYLGGNTEDGKIISQVYLKDRESGKLGYVSIEELGQYLKKDEQFGIEYLSEATRVKDPEFCFKSGSLCKLASEVEPQEGLLRDFRELHIPDSELTIPAVVVYKDLLDNE